MVRYILDNDCQSLSDLQGFDVAGYQYSEEHTTNEMQPVFIR